MKTFTQEENTILQNGPVYMVNHGTSERLVGRMMETVETLGLPSKQETAIKNILKQDFYREMQQEYSSVFLDPELAHILYKYDDWRREQRYKEPVLSNGYRFSLNVEERETKKVAPVTARSTGD